MVFSFWFVKDGIVESFVCENEIYDAEVFNKTTMKRTIAVFRVQIDDFFVSNRSHYYMILLIEI